MPRRTNRTNQARTAWARMRPMLARTHLLDITSRAQLSRALSGS